MEAAPDGLSWTFHLRRGVTFQDGAPFDASTAKFSLDRITAEGSTNAQKALFAPIRNVEVVDPATLRIRLSRPMATLPYVLAWGDAVMVSPSSAATNAVTPVGTGPFKLQSWQRGSQLTLDSLVRLLGSRAPPEHCRLPLHQRPDRRLRRRQRRRCGRLPQLSRA